MYFADLALCYYHTGPCDADAWQSPLRAIGWLEHPHSFSKGDTHPELLKRLETLIAASHAHYSSYAFRGQHQCSLCQFGVSVQPRDVRSHVNIWIPGERCIYIAPGMITHYVSDHGYQPPEEFVTAVLRCPEHGSADYCAALQAANLDSPPPLKPKDQVDAEFKLEIERALARRRM